MFGRLLDDPAGHWSIRPVGEFQSTRRYLDDTMVLETTFTTATGSVALVDALATGRATGATASARRRPNLLIRQVKGETGQVELGRNMCPAPNTA